ncbi:hypothetical protein ACQ4M4_10445 [Leptolyngbya sp. AN02str]|uniref:hypothetical protein n=1 Tax=Leptolyngbya sp. AN02str TaxID=3423363 RepID=UPI003D320AA5
MVRNILTDAQLVSQAVVGVAETPQIGQKLPLARLADVTNPIHSDPSLKQCKQQYKQPCEQRGQDLAPFEPLLPPFPLRRSGVSGSSSSTEDGLAFGFLEPSFWSLRISSLWLGLSL